MRGKNIPAMNSVVTTLPSGGDRERHLARAAERERRVRGRRRGRAWINGREVGGPDPRFAHLALTYD
jgi:hypothetical protein